MAIQLLSGTGVTSWDGLVEAIAPAVADVLDDRVSRFEVVATDSAKRIAGYRLDDHRLRLAAVGNDELVGTERLTIRDERAVIAVGFTASNMSWGTFFWDWKPPLSPEIVASGIVRVFRDIYRCEVAEIEVHASV